MVGNDRLFARDGKARGSGGRPLSSEPLDSGLNTASSHFTSAYRRARALAVLGPPILAPFEHQSQGTVMVWPTVGKYRLQVATVFPDASVSNLFLS